MALVVNDRVKETSTTTGTGTLTLDGAVTGFETFSSAIGNTNTTYYAIELPNTVHFEVGRGTVSAGQLARTEVISSSNSDNPVNFPAGTKNVFCTLPASKAVIEDANNNVTLDGEITVDNFIRVKNSGSEVFNLRGEPTYTTINSGNRTLNLLANAIKLEDDTFVERMRMHSNGNIGIGTTSPSATLDVDGSAIFNESGAAVDFRVEGDTNANLFFVDGSADSIGFGYSAPTNFITVVNPSNIPFYIHSTDANNEMVMSDTTGSIKFGTKNSGDFLLLTGGDAGGAFLFTPPSLLSSCDRSPL